MSFTAARASKLARQACQRCQERKARFQFRGKVRADRDHVLCFECFRSERDRRRARMLDAVQVEPLPVFLHSSAALSERQMAHRRRMLTHLTSAGR
jgi:hypothetical protein